MAWSKYQKFLALMMVVTGSINTLSTKWADQMDSKGSDGNVRKFDHPFLQAAAMFLGEILCLLTFKFIFWRNRNGDHQLIQGSQDFNPFILMPAAMFDLIGTSIMYIGLNLTYVSSFQMFRGSIIIFVAVLSTTFLERIIVKREWVGIATIILGLLIVGLTDAIYQSPSEAKGRNSLITGDLLIIVAQIISACQMVYEEKYVSGRYKKDMARKKKVTEAEAKLKKKEYDRKRREKMKSDTQSLVMLREKERIKYLNKKEKGQVKPVSTMTSREKRQKRKQWRINSSVYRKKKENLRRNLSTLISNTPPDSPIALVELAPQNNALNRDALASRRRRLLRKRRAILYAKINKLEKELKKEVKRREKYRKMCMRIKKQHKITSPEAKVDSLLKNTKVPIVVKKKLIYSEILITELTEFYRRLKTHKAKQDYYEIFKLDLLRKKRLLYLSNSFYKNQRYKTGRTCRKLSWKMLKIKQDVADFLEKDENSRMCPGKRDFVRLRKVLKQKRLLTDTLSNLHKKFLTTVTYKLSLSTFCRFRPFNVTWANINKRDTCKCIIHANTELIVAKLHEKKTLLYNNIPRMLAAITCDIYSTKCLFKECLTCKDKALEYYLPEPDKLVIYQQWMYETTTYEKDGKTKKVRKPMKINISTTLQKLLH